VTSLDDWNRVVAEAEAAFGPMSVLVNNAGVVGSDAIDNCTVVTYRHIIDQPGQCIPRDKGGARPRCDGRVADRSSISRLPLD